MSAPWKCWKCGGYDGERPHDRQCRCETVRAEDWALLRELWVAVREREDGRSPRPPIISTQWDGTIHVQSEAGARLDAMFFEGETIPDAVPVPRTSSGEDTCR